MKKWFGIPGTLVAFLVLSTGTVSAGPNADGVLLLHVEPAVEGSSFDYCGNLDISSPEDAHTEAESLDPYVVWVLAAFPQPSSPRLNGLTFGIAYDRSQLAVSDWRSCADSQLADGHWPSPYSGISLLFYPPRKDAVTSLAWFLAYSYDSTPTTLEVIPHPVQGGLFADDSIPPEVEPIAGYGKVGFFTSGANVLPADYRGGCCIGNEVSLMTEGQCAGNVGSEFFPDWSTGDDNPCLLPVRRASWGEVKRLYQE